jgi:hypothetical protein
VGTEVAVDRSRFDAPEWLTHRAHHEPKDFTDTMHLMLRGISNHEIRTILPGPDGPRMLKIET